MLTLDFTGNAKSNARLGIVSTTGVLVYSRQLSGLDSQQVCHIETKGLAAGLYFVGLQTDKGAEWLIWQKI
jgi:hypothetical protein